MTTISNFTFKELSPGQHGELHRLCTVDDFYVFANVSGNHNPMHLAAHDGDNDGEPEAIAPALWLGSLVSAVLGNILPGPGTLYRSQEFKFHHRARAGDNLVVRATVAEKLPDNEVVLDTVVVRRPDGTELLTGKAHVIAPTEKVTFKDLQVPGLLVQRHLHFEAMLQKAALLPPLSTAVVAPEEENSLGGALLARQHSIIEPILIGDAAKIKAVAEAEGLSLDGVELIDIADHPAAANKAVDLVREGRARALMKGHLHTDELLRACLRKDAGLRTGRRFTHVFVMDVPGVAHPLIVSDAAINISPDLATKVDIAQNAIDIAHSIGIEQPKVGVLSAVETVNPQIQSSVDAALLSKMAERGQIKGALVDGPLAMDNAVDLAAARTKGIDSQVAGRAEILIVPNLDAGNMLSKQLIYVSHAEGAGVVLGASAPIILNSRSDSDKARLASCAVAALHDARLHRPRVAPGTRAH